MFDVEPGRIVRMAEAFAAQPPGPPEVRLCAAALTLLDVDGVGVSLGASNELLDSGLQPLCSSDEGRAGEARQFDLGEGPAYTAHRTGRPVQVADLERDDRWPAFTQAATAFGLRAVFAFPLHSGSISLGALTLYKQVAGELSSEQYADALAVARFALDLLTSLQAKQLLDGLDPVFADGLACTERVSQASGVVSVQLGITVAAALAVMRAHAFTETDSLVEVATQVIDHRLRLRPLQDE